MEGFLPIFFLLVILKIPVLGGLYLVYWAAKPPVEEPEAAEESDPGMGRWRPQPNRPKGPRRGPQSGGARALPDCPPGGRSRITRPPAPARASLAHAERRQVRTGTARENEPRRA